MDAVRLDRIGRLWVVGCGNMGGALLARWLACGLEPGAVTVIDPGAPSLMPDIRIAASPAEAGPPPEILLLAIKPQLLSEVANELRGRIGDALIISVLAGSEIATLEAQLQSHRVVRAMPNTPARIGLGTTALYGGNVSGRAIAEALMSAVGAVHWLGDEHLFDAVTAVSGSGPAYVFRFIEALAAAGAAAGLPAGTASALALETVTGAAALAARREATPGELRIQVTSPNGTTAAGLAVLDGGGALSGLVEDSVAAAARRSRELASAATPVDPESAAGRSLERDP